MPSPVAHSLIGLSVAAAFYVRGDPASPLARGLARHRWKLLAGVALGNCPDIDYLPGILTGDLNAYHHAYTHSVGWVLLVSFGAWLAWMAVRPRSGMREFLFCLLAAGSHLAADLITEDRRAPFGIMALWPISAEHMISPVTLFMRLHKREWSEFLMPENFVAVGWEMLVCVPLFAIALWFGRRGTKTGVVVAEPAAG